MAILNAWLEVPPKVFAPPSGPRQHVRGEVRAARLLGRGIHVGLLRRGQPAPVRRLLLRGRQRPRRQGDLHRRQEERGPRRKGKLYSYLGTPMRIVGDGQNCKLVLKRHIRDDSK